MADVPTPSYDGDEGLTEDPVLHSTAGLVAQKWLNPGSDEARAGGCACPVMDNNHGKWAPWPPDGWWTRPDCPMHGWRPTQPAEPTT